MIRGIPAFGAVLLVATLSALPAFAEPLQRPYTLSKPAGEGPFPAVVILHDCSGLGPKSSGAPWRWSRELTPRGYVTLWPDSFSERGHPGGVCADASPPRISMEQRAGDAYAALAYLQSLPFVDPGRIAVMGGSHGGSATLATIVDNPENAARPRPGFAAAIALYPGCARSFGAWTVERATRPRSRIISYSGAFKPLAPLLILIGELDDWTPAEHCRKLAAAAEAAGYPVEIEVYPGAHHSFDSISPVRFRGERINSNSPTGRGATTGGNAGAWADAIEHVKAFLTAHLAK